MIFWFFLNVSILIIMDIFVFFTIRDMQSWCRLCCLNDSFFLEVIVPNWLNKKKQKRNCSELFISRGAMSNIVILMQYFVNFPSLTKGIFTTHGSFFSESKEENENKQNQQQKTDIHSNFVLSMR